MEFRTKLDDSNNTDSIDKTHRLKLFTEYGPLVVFFVSYWLAGLYVATGAIVVATIVVLAVSYAMEKKIPMLPLFTGGIILAIIWKVNSDRRPSPVPSSPTSSPTP